MPKKEEINKFSAEILELSRRLKCGLVETIVHYCDRNGLETEIAASLISKELKTKLKREAKQLNMLKVTRRRVRKVANNHVYVGIFSNTSNLHLSYHYH